MVKFTGGNLNQAEREAAMDQLRDEVGALLVAQQQTRLALERRNDTLRQMKAGGFRLSELSRLSGLKTAMLSRITSAKREDS